MTTTAAKTLPPLPKRHTQNSEMYPHTEAQSFSRSTNKPESQRPIEFQLYARATDRPELQSNSRPKDKPQFQPHTRPTDIKPDFQSELQSRSIPTEFQPHSRSNSRSTQFKKPTGKFDFLDGLDFYRKRHLDIALPETPRNLGISISGNSVFHPASRPAQAKQQGPPRPHSSKPYTQYEKVMLPMKVLRDNKHTGH